MSVFYRKGRWYVSQWPNGRKGKHVRIKLPKSVQDKAEALAFDAEIRKATKTVEDLSPYKDSPVIVLAPKYIEWAKLHLAAKTARDIEGSFERSLTPHLGRFTASQIDIQHIEFYKQIRSKEYDTHFKKKKVRVGNRTINKELSYFSMFLGWCAEKIKGFPKREFKIDKLPYERPIPAVLSLEEAVKFIIAAEPLYRCLFLTLFQLGVRIAEALRLRWGDIDMERKTLKITKKGGKHKILPIPEWLYSELEETKKTATSEWVFQSPRSGKPNQPVTDVRKAIERARKKAEIEKRVHPHLLRHSLATHLCDEGVNLRHIQEVLGHQDIRTTMFYTQVSTSNIKRALDDSGVNIKPPGGIRKNT